MWFWFWLWLLIGLVVGNVIGVLTAVSLFRDRIVGDLYLNNSDEEFAACGVKFNKGANDITKYEYVVIKVHTRD